MDNPLKTKLADGGVCIGGWLTVPSAATAEALATCGFDWIAVDLEHSPIGESELAPIFAAIERHGVSPMVRLPSADPYLARRVLDSGAAGLLVPVVEDAAAFAGFAGHCRYPPDGRRGVCLARMNLWGDRFDEYMADFQPVLVPQIETRRGLEAADAIARLPEVDGLFIGPFDLSADLGIAGRFEDPAFEDAIGRIRDACANQGKAAGIHQVEPDSAALAGRVQEGFRLIAFGTDIIAMRHGLKGVREIK